MTDILVSAIVEDGSRFLVVQRDDGTWDIPCGALGDEESTEDALDRILRHGFGVEIVEQEFLDTAFERNDETGEPRLRNIYRVSSWQMSELAVRAQPAQHLHWLSREGAITAPFRESVLHALSAWASSADAVMPEVCRVGAPIVILSGPEAKTSAIARLLCARLGRAARVKAGVVREMVTSAPVSPTTGEGDGFGKEERDRLELANVLALARNFSKAGLPVVVETMGRAEEYVARLAATAPTHLVSLTRESHVAAAVSEIFSQLGETGTFEKGSEGER